MRSTAVPVYCFNWHLGQSPAQKEILIDPLSSYIQFDVTAWDSHHLDLSKAKIKATPLVFFFFPPPPNLLSDSDARLVWIPMWDEAKYYSDTWWGKLPKSLRVVAFSEHIRRKAQAAGLSTLSLKYYKNPNMFQPASWGERKTLFYWNRTGLISREFLRKACDALNVEILFFRRRIDPGWPSWCDYELPKKLGNTVIKELVLNGADGYLEYLNCLNQANVFIAPRSSEGVGLSFIEAMARGCALFAYDAPTMNEYIAHKKNGYLISSAHGDEASSRGRKILQHMYKVALQLKLTNSEVLHPILRYPVKARQNWKEIAGLNLQALGNKARQDQLDGYKIWADSIVGFASFILDW